MSFHFNTMFNRPSCFAVAAAAAFLTAVSALTGCTVGPDYAGAPDVAPVATRSATFVRAPKDGVAPTPAAATWWTSLNDPELTHLIETALAHNPDLRAAQARLRELRGKVKFSRAWRQLNSAD